MEMIGQPTISETIDTSKELVQGVVTPEAPKVEAPKAPVSESNKEVVTKQSSADIKAALELAQKKEAEVKNAPKEEPKIAPAPIIKEGEVPPPTEEWFDKERGFKTKEDFINSYKSSQEKMRQQSEQLKALDAEVSAIKAKEAQKTMTPEDQQRMEAIEGWKAQNKEAIELIKAEVRKDLDQENVIRDFEKSSKQELADYKQKFDADPDRKQLWPKMDEIYRKEVITDGRGQPVFKGFFQNPLKYFEAMALKEKFPEIIERVKQDAIENYKKSQKEAAEAARSSTTALPGGPKSTGEVDVSKMSSSQLANMLPRKED